ncbi:MULTISPECIES: DUF4352 domain-containing protein [Bacillus cereus group]|uniref:DUF4352 domain-containing protein n=1 Tax=Bacillus thuringiensis serovar yosoo TaxID=180848 RepID=A0A9X6F9J5_BACTU|nr:MULTISPECIES: DUF4352 domain-containing protein [Bacillus cereus group]OTY58416.1 hypothetical protein BK746_13315 [Bacillus thuringiensis serovar yosoo]PET97491.1 DUF4352 domain-containing protein [Bacillus cereus]PEZ63632.1 DUF4352 domain-containing protein [Bacillus cereus]PFB68048.1 DUF4352 domain-containing protein [Bacillus cereus]PFO46117.1 DUF4352 domain-containing protein [Bacillus cereus]
MNKKLLASLLCSTFLFGVSACGSHDAPAKNEQATSKKTENDKLSSKDSQKELPTNVDSSDVYMSMGSAESLDVIGTGEVKAQGVFKVLDIAVYNRKEEPITLDINDFKLIDEFGREYHISNEYQSVLKDANTSTFKFGIVNPDEHSDGNIVFDVPKNTRGLTLKFNNDKLDKELQLKVELE